MARGSSTDRQPRSSDPTLSLCLLVYETNNDEFTLTTSPGLPIVPSSPFYQTLQELWSQHGNRDATPSIGLIRAVASDIHLRPRLWNFAIYRSWLDYSSDLQYVLLQSTRPNETGVLGITGSSAGTGSRRTSPRHRIGRVRSGYLAEGSSEEN
ncbi:hypothetical protein PENSTE_c021G00151 [Penicillium steckii]|uniref:Uncharacterized protein n=1 Tax=Penicillium steckii TaxID=303698 RepID=A0A1V6ST57_9EURO|nr:hypothetical protein PENSTE_c021G00151 [Penicillium steckii]